MALLSDSGEGVPIPVGDCLVLEGRFQAGQEAFKIVCCPLVPVDAGLSPLKGGSCESGEEELGPDAV